MTPIEVDEKEYLKCNKALAKLLVIVQDSQPVSTRQLLQLLKSTGYGQTTIRLAEKRGYLQRTVQSKKGTKSVGKPAVLNSLTEEGKRLARIARSLKA